MPVIKYNYIRILNVFNPNKSRIYLFIMAHEHIILSLCSCQGRIRGGNRT